MSDKMSKILKHLEGSCPKGYCPEVKWHVKYLLAEIDRLKAVNEKLKSEALGTITKTVFEYEDRIAELEAEVKDHEENDIENGIRIAELEALLKGDCPYMAEIELCPIEALKAELKQKDDDLNEIFNTYIADEDVDELILRMIREAKP